MSALPLVPGVYPAARPRRAEVGLPRTDVCGFVGFEPRIRDAGSALVGAGHRYAVDVVGFQVRLGDERVAVEAVAGLVLSRSDSAVPQPDGGSVAYALAAQRDGAVRVVPGAVRTDVHARPPDDGLVAEQLVGPHLRLADVHVRRDGGRVFVSVLPRLAPVRCDDWAAWQLAHGAFDEADGNVLARAVRAFFANGGGRCHTAPVRRVDPEDALGVATALRELVGVPGSAEAEATGFERLVLIEEVALVDVPDLYARRSLAGPSLPLPPVDRDVCFRPCGPPRGPAVAVGLPVPGAPVFSEAQVLEAQRALVLRAAAERWRLQLLLSVPIDFDSEVGAWASPTHARALAWRAALDGATDDAGAASTALYHPWLLASDREGGPLWALPPSAFAAGIVARRDLARGPLVAPANEAVVGAVALDRPVDDDDQGALYAAPHHVDTFRAFPGRGLQLWGARTQSTDAWLRFLNVRRGLSAIERRMVAALRPLVFEPNGPALWARVTQLALTELMGHYQRGTLRGASPEEAFYVRCGDPENPPAQRELGIVLCEVGVAIAAPAEFVVFRVARTDGLLSVAEGA
ncbi:MAG: phage tail sheath subtilisin-like domain-containing protein [Myxococcota bacterium]